MKNILPFLVPLFLAVFLLTNSPASSKPAPDLELPAPQVTVVTGTPAPTGTATPVKTGTTTPTPVARPTITLAPTQARMMAAGGIPMGWPGQIQCYNCSPISYRVRLTHYDPMSGPDNCWDYDKEKEFCFSPMKSGLGWREFYGLAAACPFGWPYGSWIEIETVGAFICLDRGSAITCDDKTNVCAVDILGPSGAAWDGGTFDATLWVAFEPPRKP